MKQADLFRDFGIDPNIVSACNAPVRAYFPWGHVIGQFAGTLFMSGMGAFVAVALFLGTHGPAKILAAALPILGFGYIVYRATRNDYLWIELEGDMLRAKHLYTRRLVERRIKDIDDLLTLVYSVRNLTTTIAESLLGRVRGVVIRFEDGRTPLLVPRADPAMRNAKELIEAIVYRMSQHGEVDVESVDYKGKPLIRRVYWKRQQNSASGA